MEYVDEHKVSLNDTINRWIPTLPEANEVTLKMLANQTTGYPNFETDPAWLAAFNADPFHIWTYKERLAYAFARPPQFAPGTDWSYSHTDFMILGQILARGDTRRWRAGPLGSGACPHSHRPIRVYCLASSFRRMV